MASLISLVDYIVRKIHFNYVSLRQYLSELYLRNIIMIHTVYVCVRARVYIYVEKKKIFSC